jgi:hypothetical protein
LSCYWLEQKLEHDELWVAVARRALPHQTASVMEGQQLYPDITHSTASTTSNWDSGVTVSMTISMARIMLLEARLLAPKLWLTK